MNRKRRLNNGNLTLENVKICDVAAEGKAIAFDNEMVVFVNYAIPGDIVNLRIVKKRKNYAEAIVTEIIKESEYAQNPFCEHFGVCGGCKWQRLPYSEQLNYKQKQVVDQLQRIGLIDSPTVLPIVGSNKTLYYRNKLEFTFSNKRWITQKEVEENTPIDNPNALGFHIPERFDKVLNISTCYLQPNPSNEIRHGVYDYAIKNKLEFYDLRDKTGFLRNLVIRTSTTGEVMVIVVFFHEDKEARENLLEYLKSNFKSITSLQYIINTKGNDSISDQEVIHYSGNVYINEKMEDLTFRISAKSFYQTNPEQAYKLYSIARDFSELTGKEVVYDLYTGTGTIANFVAKNASKVVGIEYIDEAIQDAKVNSQINGINNTTFYAGDMKDILTNEFVMQNGRPDVVILDPPRAGIHPDVAETLLKTAPKRIVYISCNPATQARDIALLSSKYHLVKAQPVDMFPHTHHIENVVLLIIK